MSRAATEKECASATRNGTDVTCLQTQLTVFAVEKRELHLEVHFETVMHNTRAQRVPEGIPGR
jgi:hypothetical protein